MDADRRKCFVQKRAASFRYAFRGILALIKTQPNAWIHALATAAVTAAGMLVKLSLGEWCRVVLAITVVWMAEALNTAIEFLADAAVPQRHPLVEKAKDVAAGAVLFSAIGAAVIGALVFLPHFARLLRF